MTSADLDPPIDPRTNLPALFAQRRLTQAAASSPGIPESAVAHAVRADTLLLRGDRPGARKELELALASAPNTPGLLLSLAQLEEGDKLHDAAIERYRRLIELQPANVIALNNLAYALAVYRNAPAEGLPFARRAAAIATNTGSVLDTLGWIEHLLGNHATAAKILADAIRLEANVAEIRLHAAIVAAAMGDRAKAESELKEALRLDPTLDQRDETRALRGRISALPPR